MVHRLIMLVLLLNTNNQHLHESILILLLSVNGREGGDKPILSVTEKVVSMKIIAANPALPASSPINTPSKTETLTQTTDKDQPYFMTGQEAVEHFAKLFAYPEWEAKGLTLTQETKEAIHNTFVEAALTNNPFSAAGVGVSMNIHQIVMDNQDVPSWFLSEKEMVGDLYGNQLFPNGEHYAYSIGDRKIDSSHMYPPLNLSSKDVDELLKQLFSRNGLSTNA